MLKLLSLAEAPGVNIPSEYLSYFVIGFVFIGLVGLVMGANAVDDFLDRRKGKQGTPPNEQLQSSLDDLKRRVTTVESSVMGKEWFDRVDEDLCEIKRDLKKDRDDTERHISLRSGKIYEKIDAVCGELRDEMKTQSDRRDDQIENLRAEINTLPERLLAMLKNIRELGGTQ